MDSKTCPVCASTCESREILRVNSKEATDHFVKVAGTLEPKPLQDNIEMLWNSKVCDIFRCCDCGSRFSYPHVAGDARFYELVSPHAGYPTSRWEFDLTKMKVVETLKNGGELLEIGGGNGAFAKKLIAQGLSPSKIVVAEYSEQAISDLINIGIRAEIGNFRTGVPGSPFRLIVLFQTLEHLDQLDEVLLSLRDLGTDTAEVFVSVPNVEYVDWAQENLGVTDMPPNHITAFSSKGLIKLFQRNGWETIELRVHTRNSIIDRCKYGVMRGLQFPSGTFQKFLSKILTINSRKRKATTLYLCAPLVIMSDWRLLCKVPPENLWLHARKVP